MRNLKKIALLLLLSYSSFAQDTTYVEKKFNHEIGFNTVTLLSQIVVFTPNTTDQLPFDIFYNLYFQDKYGVRLGLGVLTNIQQTTIEGQNTPRTTTKNNLNFRVGVSNNFVRTKRITLNAFADYLQKNAKVETVTTTSTQTHPNPVVVQTVESVENITGFGGQAGVGVKFNFNKYLSLYLEVPISFMYEVKNTSDLLKESGMPDLQTKSTSRSNGTKISLPTTIYLVLRF